MKLQPHLIQRLSEADLTPSRTVWPYTQRGAVAVATALHVQIFVAFSLLSSDAVLVISGGVSPRQMQTLALPNSDLQPRDTDPHFPLVFSSLVHIVYVFL